jgi:hypothetical protein
VRTDFHTFVGIDLGGTRGKTTALARLRRGEGNGAPLVLVEEVTPRHQGNEPWRDEVLVDYVASLGEGTVVGVNAPLTVPACLRCALAVCPGQAACVDPAVAWLRETGAEIIQEALQSDRDRIVAIPTSGGVGSSGRAVARRGQTRPPQLAPYVHRAAEIKLHFERDLLPRDSLGLGTGRIAARGGHLRRLLAGRGFVLNRNLLEVSPRATVAALFGRQKARGYKRDADPWETRAGIVEELRDVRFAATSRLSKEEVLSNDHCFEALLAGYTAWLFARDGWSLPSSSSGSSGSGPSSEDGDGALFDADGWIWAPPT